MSGTSVVAKTLRLSLLAGLAMGLIFPLFTLLFVRFPSPRILIIYWSACVVAGIGVGGIAFWISRSTVIRFIHSMRDQLQRYRSGEGSGGVAPLNENSADVLGEVARMMNQLVGAANVNLRDVHLKSADAYRIAAALSETITKALQLTQENKGKLMMFEADLQEMRETIDAGYGRVQAIGEQAEQARKKISEQAEVVEGSFRIADSLNQVIENLFSSLEQRIQDISRATMQVEESHQRILNSQEWIISVQESARRMQGIAGSISNIAENTGILAINASIQASHGGEAGKSFQVIAQEIRKLSDESRNNAESIQEQLRENLNLIDRTVSNYRDSVDGSQVLKGTLEETRSSFTSLRSLLSELQKSDGDIQESVSRLRETQNLVVALQTAINNQILEIGGQMEELHQASDSGGDSILELSQYSSQLFREIMRVSAGAHRASLSLEQGRLIFESIGGAIQAGNEAVTLRWNALLETGNGKLDALNRRRCAILDEMFDIIGGGQKKNEIIDSINILCDELENGFREEERLFELKTEQPHAASHREIISEMREFTAAFAFLDEDQADLSQLPDALGSWLLAHIARFDKAPVRDQGGNPDV